MNLDAQYKSFPEALFYYSSKKLDEISIPFYQRPFKWTPSQIAQLFMDLANYGQGKVKEESHYFSGAVVVLENNNSIEIVDGQQRLTVLFLMTYVMWRISIKKRDTERFGQFSKCLFSASKYKKISEAYDADEVLILDYFSQMTRRDFLDVLISDGDLGLKLKYQRNSLNQTLCNALALFDVKINEDGTIAYEQIIKENKYIDGVEEIISKDADVSSDYGCDKWERNSIVSSLDTSTYKLENIMELENNEQQILLQKFTDAMIAILYAINSYVKLYEKEKRRKRNEYDPFDLIYLCRMSTSSADDAYTFFEILNHRGIGLTSSDLIKNNFYRTYKNDDEAKRNSTIEYADQIWSSSIDSSSDTNKSIVLNYFGLFLTGNPNIEFKTTTKTREIRNIHKYLSSFGYCAYDDVRFKLDFKVLENLKLLINKIPQRKRTIAAICDVHNDSSWIKKAISYFSLIKQDGVLPLIILPLYFYIHSEKTNDFKSNLEKALHPSIEYKNSSDFKNNETISNLNRLAFRLIQVSLLSKTYSNLRDVITQDSPFNDLKADSNLTIVFSQDNLCKNNTTTSRLNFLNNHLDKLIQHIEHIWINLQGNAYLKSELIETWRYNKNQEKLNYCFSILYRSSYSHNTLLPFSVDSEKIFNHKIPEWQLDHIEPQEPQGSTPDENIYYSGADRSILIHKMGNMFPIFRSNASKGNKPFSSFESQYEKGLKSHFLYENLLSTWIKYGKDISRLPEIVDDRSNFLAELFIKIMSHKDIPKY